MWIWSIELLPMPLFLVPHPRPLMTTSLPFSNDDDLCARTHKRQCQWCRDWDLNKRELNHDGEYHDLFDDLVCSAGHLLALGGDGGNSSSSIREGGGSGSGVGSNGVGVWNWRRDLGDLKSTYVGQTRNVPDNSLSLWNGWNLSAPLASFQGKIIHPNKNCGAKLGRLMRLFELCE
ncbi:hypothetical protein K435DRAFT_349532 [Dendrothele bispora CBS 962.96]|uniref:Uncharacterized protein n=1 Tax=Dendrothele bispora (strain CBS 962.96) TaxID=1314807 RepID=A0A4S8LED6_DENBC|nr:hypothetical protein K435DRAFT_349532 [Dendrothele bispora CBS 962.96]